MLRLEVLQLRLQLLLLLPRAPVLPHSLDFHTGRLSCCQLLPLLVELPLQVLNLLGFQITKDSWNRHS